MAEEVISVSEQKKEDWLNSKWRPMMGWMYMLICTTDMVIFPILWSLLQAAVHGAVNTQWQPLTLQGAGLFHIAMGGVLGLTAYGRTQEKIAGANNGGLGQPGAAPTYTPPPPVSGIGFGELTNGNTTTSATGFKSEPTAPSTPTAGFSAPVGSVSSPAASTAPGISSGGSSGGTFATATVVTGFGGKPAPQPAPQPAI
jgi:hypothetical protein